MKCQLAVPEISSCNVDVGIARDGGRARTASGGVIAVNQIGDPGGASGGCDERVEFEFVHDEVDALGAAEPMIRRKSIGGILATWADLSAPISEEVLSEVGHLRSRLTSLKSITSFKLFSEEKPRRAR